MSTNSVFDKIIEVSTLELAQIIGVTDRRVRQLEEAGVLTKITRGKYNLIETLQVYITWLREQAELTASELNLTQEQALLTRTRRKIAELDLQIMKGEMHRAEDVETVMNQMLSAFRARCLAIPTKTAPQVVGKKDITVVQNLLKKEVYEALHELAEYNSGAFYKASKDKIAVKDTADKAKKPPEKEVKRRAGSKAKQ